ncbi:MAG TPA: hypothetical protein VMY05_01335 [Acidobacteriota bacterium]|nr:hypothetical protein [Acidobacteriota bacterium]
MNRLVACFILLWPALCFSQAPEPAGTGPVDYFNSENLLRFADYLYERGDYLRAAGEYQRYLFSLTAPGSSDSTYYRMVKAVFLGGDYGHCRRLLDALAAEYPRSPFAAEVPLFQAVVAFHLGEYERSLALAGHRGVANAGLAAIVTGTDYLYLGDFEMARRTVCPLAEAETSLPDYNPDGRAAMIAELCEKAILAQSLPSKSKLQAGVYSALLPGAGKKYCGHTADGFYSLLLVGLTAWQAYDGFHEDGSGSTRGWIFGVLGTSFYLGNVYGSVVAAELYNRRSHEDFLRGLQVEITLP